VDVRCRTSQCKCASHGFRQVVNFLARISRSLSISPLLGGARGPYIRDEHRSIATAYFESPGTLDMKVRLAEIFRAFLSASSAHLSKCLYQ